MSNKRAAVLMVAGALSLGGCMTDPASGGISVSFIGPEGEKRVGAETHPSVVLREGGRFNDAALAAYVDRIGQSLARHAETRDVSYTFTVLDGDVPNAFALPGGYVAITRGLLALLDSEAEVASVLAHEIGHVTARHYAEQSAQRAVAEAGIELVGLLALWIGLQPDTADATRLLLHEAFTLHDRSYDRDQEREADELAVRYMVRAGYDPRAVVSSLRKLEAYERLMAEAMGDPGAPDRFSWMATHPTWPERVRSAERLVTGHAGVGGRTGREEHLRAIDGMTFGGTPSQGIRRGREYVDPLLRVAFRVPPEFMLLDSGAGVAAVSPDGAAISVRPVARTDLARRTLNLKRYLRKTWPLQADPDDDDDGDDEAEARGAPPVETFRVGDLPGATRRGVLLLGEEEPWKRLASIGGLFPLGDDRKRWVRVAVIRDRERLWHLVFVSPRNPPADLDAQFLETARSFRRLSPQEAKVARPLRLRVATVQPGELAETLAMRMPIDSFQMQTFRLLNGLQPGQTLADWQQVKTIVK